jgi:hypothetical protein
VEGQDRLERGGGGSGDGVRKRGGEVGAKGECEQGGDTHALQGQRGIPAPYCDTLTTNPFVYRHHISSPRIQRARRQTAGPDPGSDYGLASRPAGPPMLGPSPVRPPHALPAVKEAVVFGGRPRRRSSCGGGGIGGGKDIDCSAAKNDSCVTGGAGSVGSISWDIGGCGGGGESGGIAAGSAASPPAAAAEAEPGGGAGRGSGRPALSSARSSRTCRACRPGDPGLMPTPTPHRKTPSPPPTSLPSPPLPPLQQADSPSA